MPNDKKPAKKIEAKETEEKTVSNVIKKVKEIESKATESKPVDTKVAKNTKTETKTETKVEATKKSAKKVPEEEIVDDSDSDAESELEAGSEEDNEMKIAKDKKVKKTFDELHNDFEQHSVDIKAKKVELSEINKLLKSKEKEISDLEKKQSKIWALFSKAKDEDVKKAANTRPKRKGNSEGGFNKPVPVPLVLSKFLELEDGILMSRPKLMSAMTNAFKEAGLKEGQMTTLDAKTAKALGKEKGREIPFGKFQTFLAEFFNESTNVVDLA